jgi:hypothetical protein
MEKVKFPNQIIQKLQNNAPSYDAGENYGRRGGFYGDSEESAAGYKSICIYVQNGLDEYLDLFKEIAKGVFKIQSNHVNKYPLLVFGFGNTDHLQHEKKFFDFGYLNDSLNSTKVAETIARISGPTPCVPAIIPELFPKTDLRSLYSGKIKIEREDLLIIIGRENEVFLNETLKDKFNEHLKKQVLLVEIGNEGVAFKIKGVEFDFKPIKTIPNRTTMATKTTSFKRNLSTTLIAKLQAEPLYPVLLVDIEKGDLFPAIRHNLIDFYYKGGKLFQYDDRGFQTHIKYAAVIEKGKSDYLTEKELGSYKLSTDFAKNYQRIKENCARYAGVEANGVSEIYHRHSYVGRDSGIVVLDIEVSFKSLDEEKSQDRIDILLYNADEKKLKFVEAKHYSNSEIWSRTVAKVIGQIKRYEGQIGGTNKAPIIAEYNKYIDITNGLFKGTLPHINDIDEKVTLLIFDFDSNQKSGRLKTLITENTNFKGVITNYCIGNIEKISLVNLWNAK